MQKVKALCILLLTVLCMSSCGRNSLEVKQLDNYALNENDWSVSDSQATLVAKTMAKTIDWYNAIQFTGESMKISSDLNLDTDLVNGFNELLYQEEKYPGFTNLLYFIKPANEVARAIASIQQNSEQEKTITSDNNKIDLIVKRDQWESLKQSIDNAIAFYYSGSSYVDINLASPKEEQYNDIKEKLSFDDSLKDVFDTIKSVQPPFNKRIDNEPCNEFGVSGYFRTDESNSIFTWYSEEYSSFEVLYADLCKCVSTKYGDSVAFGYVDDEDGIITGMKLINTATVWKVENDYLMLVGYNREHKYVVVQLFKENSRIGQALESIYQKKANAIDSGGLIEDI